MTVEQNKAVVRRFIDEFWNERKLDLAGDLFAGDCVTHQLRSDVETAGTPRTPESVKREAAAWLAGFPDLRFDAEQMIAEEDHVVTRCTMYGTHTGAWMGVAPTDNQISVRMIVIHRIADGRIAEDWVLVGALGLFQQLGLVPTTEEILAQAME